MNKRALGNSGLTVTPLTLGGNVFGWTADKPTSFAILDAFVDRGFDSIDTADVYTRWIPGNHGGESETILGEWFKRSGARDKVVLATKVGKDMGDGKQGLKKPYILKAAEASLKRLQTDHIDLYQSHDDDSSTPLDETLEAFQQLIQDGKVRAIGASNYTGARLTEALETATRLGLPHYTTLQPNYNLCDREDFETDLAPVAERFGIGVNPYFSLAAGFLTGKYKSKADAEGKARAHRVMHYFNPRGERILQALADVEQQTGAQQASIAIAWLLAQPTVIAPLASATSVSQLQSLFAAADLKLTPAQLQTLTDASAY